jgi:Zinc finger C-x8-C-x5-C-x3-H type (and similar)/Zinc finger, C3HC4 type (RING finger)
MGENSSSPVNFKRRTREVRAIRKRPRTPSPEGPNDLERRTCVGANKAQKSSSGGGMQAGVRASWRDEYRADAVNKDSASFLATAGRHRIDAADVASEPEQRAKGLETQQTANVKKKAFGPLRAPVHIRTTIHTDMRPDICKDYQQTGYCGFGDSCIFLHDRTVYKRVAQVEKEWEELQEARRAAVARGEDPDTALVASQIGSADTDGLPFACFICRGPFTTPVVTLCEHYFCEACALKRMETDTKCAVCAKPLRGVLNAALKLASRVDDASTTSRSA